MMIFWILLISALLLSIERIAYFLIWNNPDTYRKLCQHPLIAEFGEPVDILQKLFYGFKALQIGVFIGWCFAFEEVGKIPMPTDNLIALIVGSIMVLTGIFLNLSVFHSLGKIGVFYGNKLGYHVPWREEFPFSLCRHPQYVGTLLSIWGFFLVMRFPHPDWILLPMLETFYYALGAHYEE